MDIFLKQPVKNMNELLPSIQHLFPEHQFQVPPLNKKRLLITKGGSKAAAVLLLKDNGSRVVVKAEPNMKNAGNIITMIIGFIFMPLGLLIAMGIIYGMGGAERKRVAAETYELVSKEVA